MKHLNYDIKPFNKLILYTTLLSIFFIPQIIHIKGLNLKIDDITILLFIPILLLLNIKTFEFKNKYFILLLVSLFFMFLSTVHSYIFLEVPFSSRDINELVRMSKPLLLFSFLLLFTRDYLLDSVYKFLKISLFVFIFIGFIEILTLPVISQFVIDIYSSSTQSGYGRINTTLSNPNDAAVFTMFFLFFSIATLIATKNKTYIFTTLSLIVILLNTGSRTAFLSIITLFIFWFSFEKSILLKYKIYTLIALVFLSVLFFPLLEPYFNRVLSLINAFHLKDTSLNIRFRLWGEALDLFYQSKLFGWGIAKSIHHTVVDGEYFMLLRRYGVLGLLSVLVVIYYPINYIYKNKGIYSHKEKILSFTLLGYIFTSFFIMFTNSFFTSYSLVLPFILLTAVLLKDRRKV